MLYYKKRGRGPTVILLHGLPCNHTIWDKLTTQLANQFSFIVPDFPGAGNSSFIAGGFELTDMAVEINDILTKEKINKAVIAGHSMGGYTAVAFAKMFPQKTKAISLIHASTAADSEEKKQIRRKSIALIQKGESEKSAFVKALVKNLFSEEFAQKNQTIVQETIQSGSQPSAASIINYYKALMNREDNSDLPSCSDCIFQWILGVDDNATLLTDSLPLATQASKSDICVYNSCGHMAMLEKPDKLKEDLSRFWQYVYT